jgi:hypothetical protein
MTTDPLKPAKDYVEEVKRRHGVTVSEEKCPSCGGERWWIIKLPDGSDRRLGCPCFMPEVASFSRVGVGMPAETTTTYSLVCERCATRCVVDEQEYEAMFLGGYVCPSCKEKT